jgi:hypothetical protein
MDGSEEHWGKNVAAADLNRLIADARLILEYAIRAGKLQDDSLAVAIQQMEDSERAQEIIALQNAMNGVVAQIAPMTLVDLRAGRNPFDQRNVHARGRWQIGLSFATLGLIAVIAYYQYLVQRQEAALHAYHEVVEARGSERITDVRMLVQRRNALEKDSCHQEAYQKAQHQLRSLANQSLIASKALFDLSGESAWPFVDSFLSLAGWVREGSASTVPIGDAMAAASSSVASKAAQDAGSGYSTNADLSYAPNAKSQDLCDEEQSAKLIAPGYPGWLRTVVLDSIDEFCFASKLSVDSLAEADPFRRGTASPYGPRAIDYDPVAKVEQRMHVQTGWLLPFLYGLLGACVYVMRRLLFNTKAAVVENVVIVLRLALGALAGVAIGWVTLPNAGLPAYSSASSLPYVLAFLAGFSIDILFAMLDRLNRLLVDKAQTAA